MKKILLTLSVLLTSLSALAYDFEVDGIYYNAISRKDLTCEVTHGDNKYSGDVNIPSSVTYNGRTFSVIKIGDFTFQKCTDMTSISLPSSLITIGECAFYYCKSLTNLTLPKSLITIEGSAFDNCSGLTTLTLPNSVAEIGHSAFWGCTGLTSVTLSNSLTSIGKNAFAECNSLTTVTVPNSVTYLGEGVFAGCTNLTSVSIGSSVDMIRDSAFDGCSSLTSIIIPNSATAIGTSAFRYCSGLTSVTLGSSVNKINLWAFAACSMLSEIKSLNPTPPYVYWESFYDVKFADCVVKVPQESVEDYQSAEVWEEFWDIVALDSETSDKNQTCAAPTISIVDGKISVKSETKGAKCYTSVTTEDYQNYDGVETINLSGIYKITAYAHADGYENSETVEMMLYWSKPSLDAEGEATLVGDVNGDGEVDVNDVVTLVGIILDN